MEFLFTDFPVREARVALHRGLTARAIMWATHFFGTFAKLRKATVNHVCPHELGTH